MYISDLQSGYKKNLGLESESTGIKILGKKKTRITNSQGKKVLASFKFSHKVYRVPNI